jgi:hypothetical protein
VLIASKEHDGFASYDDGLPLFRSGMCGDLDVRGVVLHPNDDHSEVMVKVAKVVEILGNFGSDTLPSEPMQLRRVVLMREQRTAVKAYFDEYDKRMKELVTTGEERRCLFSFDRLPPAQPLSSEHSLQVGSLLEALELTETASEFTSQLDSNQTEVARGDPGTLLLALDKAVRYDLETYSSRRAHEPTQPKSLVLATNATAAARDAVFDRRRIFAVDVLLIRTQLNEDGRAFGVAAALDPGTQTLPAHKGKTLAVFQHTWPEDGEVSAVVYGCRHYGWRASEL